METNNITLESVYDSIWSELKEGAAKRKHPFHLCFFSSISFQNSGADSRIIILRDVNVNDLLLRSNCDTRSNKAEDIRKNPNTTLLFYDQVKKIQIRIKAESEIVDNLSVIEPIWSASQEISKRCYYAPQPPSSTLDEPFSNQLLDLDDQKLGINVFGLIVSRALEIDYLSLNYDGHIRCHYILKNNELISSSWVAP
jgi:hypothetical protein